MSVFSTNQARQFYVAKNVDSGLGHTVAAVKDGNFYITHEGHGGVTRSDLIDVNNIMYAKITAPSEMQRNLKKVTVTVNNIVGGQDYILKVAFRQFAGISDEDIYTKFGMVHATTGMLAAQFYAEMAVSLAKNFSREATKLVKFVLSDGTEVKATDNPKDLKGSYTNLVIEEVEQDLVLGVKPLEPVYFDVTPGTIVDNGDEVVWGETKVEDSAAVVENGKLIADLEYFCMGERADIYRGVGFPNNIPTKYMVDETKEYYVLDIHYAYVGSNESVQKSEKDLTIVSDNKDALKSLVTVLTGAGVEVKNDEILSA